MSLARTRTIIALYRCPEWVVPLRATRIRCGVRVQFAEKGHFSKYRLVLLYSKDCFIGCLRPYKRIYSTSKQKVTLKWRHMVLEPWRWCWQFKLSLDFISMLSSSSLPQAVGAVLLTLQLHLAIRHPIKRTLRANLFIMPICHLHYRLFAQWTVPHCCNISLKNFKTVKRSSVATLTTTRRGNIT